MTTGPFDTAKIFEQLEKSDDRSVAIVGAAVVEDALFYAICTKLGVNAWSAQAKELQEDRGLLGT
ncbi:MAG: hypothetical protein M3T55_14875, partial [Pseudomonadota bacterium]|nr:hypothetical protein [Pseudomonadota bacterium]